jgi:hypothetical protein
MELGEAFTDADVEADADSPPLPPLSLLLEFEQLVETSRHATAIAAPNLAIVMRASSEFWDLG